jgi:hypothetical protein
MVVPTLIDGDVKMAVGDAAAPADNVGEAAATLIRM